MADTEDLDFKIKIGEDMPNDAEVQSKKAKKKKSPTPQEEETIAPENAENPKKEEKIFDLKKSAHPVAIIFHLLFKVSSIICFLLLNGIIAALSEDDQEVVTFIIVLILAAFDFWTVKNITGRLLVGLRWWSEVMDDGTEKWFFESYDQKVKLNVFDKTVFWWSSIITCLFWIAMILFELITFKFFWATCAIMCFVMSSANYLGFSKCSKDHKKKLKGTIQRLALAGLTKNFTG